MTGSLKKLINKEVYEKNADRPWAKFKDFIFSDDGKCVKYAVLSTESIIPVLYTVEFCAFENISDIASLAILKEGTKPSAIKPHYDEPKSFEKLKKKKVLLEGKSIKLRDVYFDTEIGEITDFVASGMLHGRKIYYSPENAGFFLDDLFD